MLFSHQVNPDVLKNIFEVPNAVFSRQTNPVLIMRMNC